MINFQLNPTLTQTSESIIEFDYCDIRLSHNALIPWILIIPKTDKTEWFELDLEMQNKLNQLINQLSLYLKISEGVDKINFAIIGNIVSQMHIHVIGRFKNDFCWPDVIWGKTAFLAYEKDKKEKRKKAIIAYLDQA